MNKFIENGLEYVNKGWKVFPLHGNYEGNCDCGKDCHSPCKHPWTASGVKDATDDIDVIKDWGKQYPLANIGIATGATSGIWVLDVDTKSGGGDTLRELKENKEFNPTLAVRTGGGGIHLYYRYPSDRTVGNRTGVFQGIDVRGDGGYVVAPPSIHSNGKPYEWIDESTAINDAPQWLLDAVTKPKAESVKSEAKDEAVNNK